MGPRLRSAGTLKSTAFASSRMASPGDASPQHKQHALWTSKHNQCAHTARHLDSPPPDISPAVPTPVYDTYWRFAAERQEVFFRRLTGETAPWTDDPILQEYRFTNVYRAADRTSQYLINRVIYNQRWSRADYFFRIMLFKLFNKIETWELLSQEIGEPCLAEFDLGTYDRVLADARQRGLAIFSGAYIMPSGTTSFHGRSKHLNMLRLIERMLQEGIVERLRACSSLQMCFELIRSYPMMGDFLAYQLVTDLNYSPLLDFSENDFTVPGPGAKDGIKKCFASTGGLSEAEIIKLMCSRQETEFERLGISFRTLWGRPLSLIDCQNVFCEVDKYARVRHPTVSGHSGRLRIKRRFAPDLSSIDYSFPPKWGLKVTD